MAVKPDVLKAFWQARKWAGKETCPAYVEKAIRQYGRPGNCIGKREWRYWSEPRSIVEWLVGSIINDYCGHDVYGEKAIRE